MSYDSFIPPVFRSLNDQEFLLKFNVPCLIVLCEIRRRHSTYQYVSHKTDSYYSGCINDKNLKKMIFDNCKSLLYMYLRAIF